MAKKNLRLLLAFHHHQPVGNFPEAMEVCCRQGYWPLLQAMERAHAVKFHLSYSSEVLRYLEKQMPEYQEMLRRMVERGQVEILGCGHHEPVLADLPEDDRQAQLALSLDYWERWCGRRPQGVWLAEAVWEESLAGSLQRAGVTHTLLTRERFIQGGVAPGRVQGYFITDYQGAVCRVFPMDEGLQRLMPFGAIEELMQYLRRQAGRGDAVLTFGDQAERWGVWPGTRERVLQSGYADQLFTRLMAEAEWIQSAHFSEVLARTAPQGRCSLPPGVSKDLGMWSLPDEARVAFQEARRNLEVRFDADQFLPYFRVGSWAGFRVRYAEANWMYQTGLWLKRRAQEAGCGEALDWLREAQCNTAYWYGTAGGIYAPHLREAVWERLLRAHARMACPAAVEIVDLDADGADEVVVASERELAVLAPAQGGGLAVYSVPGRPVNALNVMTRRKESSQGKADRTIAQLGGESWEADRAARLSFQDIFLVRQVSAEELMRRTPDAGDFYGKPYRLREAVREGDGARVEVERAAQVQAGGGVMLRVQKTFRWISAQRDCLVVQCRVGNEAAVPVRFIHALETNWGLPGSGLTCGTGDFSREALIPWMQAPAGPVWLHSPQAGIRIEMDMPAEALAWSYPLTFTQSNEEVLCQGVTLVTGVWLEIEPGAERVWEQCVKIVTT